jgi:hypothetical protein
MADIFHGSMGSFSVGNGQAGASAEELDGITNMPAAQGVLIKNIDAANNLHVGWERQEPTTSLGFVLQPNEEHFFVIKDTHRLRVIAAAGTADYTWVQY